MSHHPRRRFLGRAASHDALLGLGMGVASALGYLLVVIMSRALGPADFGGYSAFNSIGLVLTIPAGAFQVVYAARVARRGPQAMDLRIPVLLSVLVCLLTIALSPVLAHVTRVDTPLAPVVLALSLPPVIINGSLMGGLLGMRRFGTLALAYTCTGLLRVAAAIATATFGLGLVGALAMIGLAGLVMTGVLWWFARQHARLPWAAHRGTISSVLRTLYRSNSAIGVLMALTTVDVVLARYVLPNVAAGEYALVSTLGRSPIWVTQFLALALVPTLATSGSRRSILRAGGLVLAVCLVGAGVAAVAPDFWIRLLGGSAYGDADRLLLPYLALGTLLALAQVLVLAEMARGRHLLAKVAWLAVGIEVTLGLTVARGNAILVLGSALVAAALVVVVGVVELLLGRSAPVARGTTPATATEEIASATSAATSSATTP